MSTEPFTPTLRMGWRHFECPDCSRKWREATRDCFSPSGEDCAKCGTTAHPYHGVVDLTLAVDASMNLTMPWSERVIEET